MKKEIVAIDIHSHFNHGSPFDEHGRVPGFRHRASRMYCGRKSIFIRSNCEGRLGISEGGYRFSATGNISTGRKDAESTENIGDMPSFVDRYPDMNLIIAHLGSIAHVDAIATAKYGNIYTDTYSCAFQYGRIALYALSDKDKANILYKNAMHHFPAAFHEFYMPGTL